MNTVDIPKNSRKFGQERTDRPDIAVLHTSPDRQRAPFPIPFTQIERDGRLARNVLGGERSFRFVFGMILGGRRSCRRGMQGGGFRRYLDGWVERDRLERLGGRV